MRFKVVVIDDKPLIRRSLIETIQWEVLGCEIAGEAENGLEAKEVIRKVKPHLIISDIKMPGLDGLSLTEFVKEFLPDTKVIIITGYQEFEYAKKAIQLGVCDLVLKPIDNGAMEVIIQKAIDSIREQLQKEHYQRQLLEENDRYKMKIDRSLKALQSQFLMEVIKGRRSPDRMDADETVNLHLGERNFSVILARIRSSDQQVVRESANVAVKLMEHFKEACDMGFVDLMVNQDLVFIAFHRPGKSAREHRVQMKRCLYAMNDRLLKEQGSVCCFAVSRITNDVAKLEECYKNTVTMLKTKIAGGDAPDIIMGRPRVYADLIEAGHIADLSDQPFLKNLSDTTLSSMKVDGKVYGIPLSLGGMGIFYNREVFEKYGVQIPKSHKDLLAAADKFEEAGIIPFAHGFKEGWTAQCDIQSDLYGYPLQQNPKMFEDIQNGTKKFADYPEFRECLQRNADRLSYEGGDDFGTDVSKARSMLINGEAAMFIGGNWDISEFINNKVDDKIGFFATPNTNDSEPVQGLAPDGSFMLYSKSEHKEEALKFLEFWSSEEAFTLWNVNGSNIPCSLDASTDGISPLVADIMEIARNGKTYNYESEPVFSGQFDSTFRAWQEEFAADPDRDVDTYIQKLDDELGAIK
ncbi:MAG: extracellular solute-binding protein [Clostridiales bacterium]|nr:extracellular solute-binding protein [Clostridiales bacterium]MDU3243998.1 extracellular solute-binding protein [Clostridiales bacterium]